MMWFTPRFLIYGFFAGQTVAFRSTENGGFQDIFEAMIDDQQIDIKHYFDVKVIQGV